MIIIESGVFPNDDVANFKCAAKRSGINCTEFVQSEIDNIKMDDKDAFYYGSIQTFDIVMTKFPFIKHCCSFPQYQYIKYYPFFREYLLNEILFDVAIEQVNQKMVEQNKAFIRPNSGKKPFSGMVVDFSKENIADIQREFKIHNGTRTIVSSCKRVIREWRAIICEDFIVDINMYSDLTTNLNYEYCPKPLVHYIMGILSNCHYRPDYLFTLDIGELENGEYKMIELNSFSCAGLYTNNFKVIVDKLKKRYII